MKIKAESLINVCYACPSAWEGITEDNRPVYIKFRRNVFKIYIGEPNESLTDMFYSEKWPGPKYHIENLTGNEWAGFLSNKKLHKLLISLEISANPQYDIPDEPDPNANYDQDALLNFLENRKDDKTP